MGEGFNHTHQHGCLPDLKWVSPSNSELISTGVALFAETTCWKACSAIFEADEVLLSQIRDFDFRYIRLHIQELPDFASWLLKQVGLATTRPSYWFLMPL